MATFAQDNFVDTSGTLLTAHTGEVGATWTRHTSYPSGVMNITDANSLRKDTTAAQTCCFYASGTPAAADYDVQANIIFQSALNMSLGVAARIATGANTMYFARWFNASTRWELFKIVAGTATSLGTFSDTFSSGTRTMKLQCYDAAKKLFIDGVERISSTDNAVTAAGLAGVREGTTVTQGNATGFHLDTFSASDPVSGDVGPLLRGGRLLHSKLQGRVVA